MRPQGSSEVLGYRKRTSRLKLWSPGPSVPQCPSEEGRRGSPEDEPDPVQLTDVSTRGLSRGNDRRSRGDGRIDLPRTPVLVGSLPSVAPPIARGLPESHSHVSHLSSDHPPRVIGSPHVCRRVLTYVWRPTCMDHMCTRSRTHVNEHTYTSVDSCTRTRTCSYLFLHVQTRTCSCVSRVLVGVLCICSVSREYTPPVCRLSHTGHTQTSGI